MGADEKSIKTCMKKYSVKRASQNKEVYNKIIRSRWKIVKTTHWKTGESIVCMSSYEYAVVRKLNDLSIDFDWQIKKQLPNGMTYFVDLYLKEQNKYIEIKGYFFNERNKIKWELFHRLNKNSEIWFGDKVSEFVEKKMYSIKKEFKEKLA
jgi:hypothetical protein